MARFSVLVASFMMLLCSLIVQPSHGHRLLEVHQGYDIIADLLNTHSHLWVIPKLRRLTFGAELHEETKYYIELISSNASTRKKELARLRELDPPVSARYKHPDQARNHFMEELILELASRIVKTTVLDWTDMFDVDFFLVRSPIPFLCFFCFSLAWLKHS